MLFLRGCNNVTSLSPFSDPLLSHIDLNKIRDLFKVKLYIIRSEIKREREREKREREDKGERERKREKKKREGDFKYLLTLILTGGHKLIVTN